MEGYGQVLDPYMHFHVWRSVEVRVGYLDGVGTGYNLCRVLIYSNSRVCGHGRLEWFLHNRVEFCYCFMKRLWFYKGSTGRVRRGRVGQMEMTDGVLKKSFLPIKCFQEKAHLLKNLLIMI